MEKPFLTFYYNCLNNRKYKGRAYMGECISGLCGRFGSPFDVKNDIFKLFKPIDDDFIQIGKEGKNVIFWASGLPSNHPDETYILTPLRETIVLFCAAINDEL